MTRAQFLKFYEKERLRLLGEITKIDSLKTKSKYILQKRIKLLKELGALNKKYKEKSKHTKAELKEIFKNIKVESSEPVFVGKFPQRNDLEIEPESEESKQAKRNAYNAQQEKIKNDPEYAKQLEEECKKWHEEEKEFLRIAQIEREASWAAGIPTLLIEPHFYKPYPKLSNPDIPFKFEGFELVGFKVFNNLGVK